MEIYMDDFNSQFPYEIGIDFKYIETIDHGAFGTVIHVIEISTNKDMAIKVINKSSSHSSLIKKVKEEISILKKLNHENIVKFFGFFETNNQLLIKMEYIKYGTLSKWIKTHKKISEEEASTILHQIFSAVMYLHGKQICHRDIKPENIMLSRENDLNSIKIIDFGLSSQNFDKLMHHDYCGTYIYMAPEQIEKKLYFISVDIWSIGILMFMLLNNGKHPFYMKGISKKDFDKKIQSCKINFYNKVSLMAKHLIFKLLEPNPSWRYNASQAIKHPWITRNKYDEVPLTFNEILHKSNMKKVGRNIFGTVLLLNYLKKKKKYYINDKYEKMCKFYDEKIKIKINKKKEHCLDVLSTCEDDDSENPNEKSIFIKKLDKNIDNNQNSYIISYTQARQKTDKRKKISYAKSSKCLGKIRHLFCTEKKPSVNFKKIDYKIDLFEKKRDKIGSNNKKPIYNSFRQNFMDLSINYQKDNKTKDYINRKPINYINRQYKFDNSYKSIRNIDDSKKYIFNNKYKEIVSKKEFPEINMPIKKEEINKKEFSSFDSENYLVIPFVLPNIKLTKKDNNHRSYVKKCILKNESIKIKNS